MGNHEVPYLTAIGYAHKAPILHPNANEYFELFALCALGYPRSIICGVM